MNLAGTENMKLREKMTWEITGHGRTNFCGSIKGSIIQARVNSESDGHHKENKEGGLSGEMKAGSKLKN